MPLTTINGFRHFYEDVGNGEPVFMLHGVMNSSRYFEKLIPDVAIDFRVVAPHLRGMGFSEHVARLPRSAWVSDVVSLMDELGIENGHFYGVSLGGGIAMRLAIEHPERVRTLTLDSPVIALGTIPSMRERRAGKFPLADVVEELRATHGDDWLTVQENCDGYLGTPEIREYLNLGSSVAAISAPTLIIRGDIEEPFHPLVQAVDLHGALADSWLWIAPGTRSLMTRRHPADSSRIFREFLCAHSALPADDLEIRQRIDLLAASELFASLGGGALTRLAAGADVVTSRAGDVVFSQGDAADGLYVVIGGAFCLSIPGAGGSDVRVRTLEIGDFFGEMALLTNEPRSATVRCARDGELLRVNRTHMRALLERDATAATTVATTLTRCLQAQNRALRTTP